MSVALPSHRARYPIPELKEAVREVLAPEGLVLNDLKARILRRAYLPKGGRPLLLLPAEVRSEMLERDDQFAGREAMRLSFVLPRGAYATLVLKRLALAEDSPSPGRQPSATAGQRGETGSKSASEA
jgi:tRNA pseudouridine13 synthase